MNVAGNTVLITGGASGIGFAFAERFIKAGSKVIICGRREEKLREAKEKYPDIITRVADVSSEADRLDLFDWITENHPEVNVLVNNAGIQQRYNILTADAKDNWSYFNQEITANIEAPMHLAMLFVPHFAQKDKAAIINVTSGLGFTPMAIAPIYSATKAAMHSFTVSIRHQLSETAVDVIEVAPPAVNTDLGGVGLHTFGTPVDEFADAIFEQIEAGSSEMGYARSEKARKMTREEIDQAVAGMYENMKDSIK
ncbi:SDR family oxidoreductase [Terribacillus saccharophilus]|uniref:SDR family oxidoreductase n=1 Tax=Terribacillus saccharophilus TaxID=361277 RepID=UPI003981B2FB